MHDGGGGGGRGSVVTQPEKERITELEEMCTHTAQCFSSNFSFYL